MPKQFKRAACEALRHFISAEAGIIRHGEGV